uniref:Permease YjgP/YjgQ family protein n=1 Tax=uncultured marine thaumarchaeote AD1000_06_A03 TaxID=1455884 RepID=A0A075FHE5_9ARCH|nr:permease YjgP/YjgQ family protein [uncultured marine thaumarchaeote AD1000_06_A03]
MLSTADRYILREVLRPFSLSLLVFTFLLMIPPIMEVAEELIVKGADGLTILKLMGTLVPQALGITIPISLLVGILMGLGRLCSDREMVAFQACGFSVYRILFSLFPLAIVSGLVTCYIFLVPLPNANQAFREISFQTVAQSAEGEVKPRVFYEGFPNVMLYVRETSLNGWTDVFLADSRSSDQPDVYVAKEGQVVIDPQERRVDIVLRAGMGHQVDSEDSSLYSVHAFDEMVIGLDPDAVFLTDSPNRGYAELTVSQLSKEVERLREANLPSHRPIMEIHRKFSIPIACLVFVLMGVGLGITNRKDSKLSSFALGIAVVFSYYVLMYGSEAVAAASLISPHLAMWLPNIILGFVGVLLVMWRSSLIEWKGAIPFLSLYFKRFSVARKPNTTLIKGQVLNINLLDWYITKLYMRVVFLAFVGFLGVFYISTFIDRSNELYTGQTTGWTLLEYFWYATPQFSYYVLPVSVLVATLITVGLLSKTSELTVMKACGISVYRATFPVLLISLIGSGLLFGMSESILAGSNRRAEALDDEIRNKAPRAIDGLNRKWIVSKSGEIYNYLFFEPDRNELGGLSIYEFEGHPWTLARRSFIKHATYDNRWEGSDVWVREFDRRDVSFVGFSSARNQLLPSLESPEYFETEQHDAQLMNAGQLNSYIKEVQTSGFDVVGLMVAFHRKISFPFITLILTLIAVPFAVTTGPRGALYGVSIGIAIACLYWIIISLFAAIGSAGILTPILAAWAPNLLFGAFAVYLLLSVKT